MTGKINLVATSDGDLSESQAAALLESRSPHPALAAHPDLPDDTRLWAALQTASGGTWSGCVFDTDRIIEVLQAGLRSFNQKNEVTHQ
jgi:hypothetical protein